MVSSKHCLLRKIEYFYYLQYFLVPSEETVEKMAAEGYATCGVNQWLVG